MQSGTPISVGPKIQQIGNRVLLDQGQFFYLSGDSTAASDGLLATVTVTPKVRVDCPDPGVAPPAEVTADFDLAILAAPGGVKYEVTALAGRFVYLADGGWRLFLPFVMRSH